MASDKPKTDDKKKKDKEREEKQKSTEKEKTDAKRDTTPDKSRHRRLKREKSDAKETKNESRQRTDSADSSAKPRTSSAARITSSADKTAAPSTAPRKSTSRKVLVLEATEEVGGNTGETARTNSTSATRQRPSGVEAAEGGKDGKQGKQDKQAGGSVKTTPTEVNPSAKAQGPRESQPSAANRPAAAPTASTAPTPAGTANQRSTSRSAVPTPTPAPAGHTRAAPMPAPVAPARAGADGRRHSAPAGVTPATASNSRGATSAQSSNGISSYGTMGPQQYGSMRATDYSLGQGGFNSFLGPQGTSAYGGGASGKPDAFGTQSNTMYGGGMRGTQGPSAYGKGANSFFGTGANGTSMYGGNQQPYGSFAQQPGSFGQKPDGSGSGSSGGHDAMYGAFNADSQYGTHNAGSLNGIKGGASYGGGGGATSMYGMGGMRSMAGSGMGSMWGGMNPSMRGTSLYNTGTVGRYNSMNLGSEYASLYNIGRHSSRSSFRSTGGYQGPFGLYCMPVTGSARSDAEGKSFRGPDGELYSELPPQSSKLTEPFSDSSGGATQDGVNAPAAEATGVKKRQTDGADAARTKRFAEEAEAARKRRQAAAAAAAADAEERQKKEAAAAAAAANTARELPGGTPARVDPVAPPRELTKSVNDNVHAIAVVDSRALMRDAKTVQDAGGVSHTMDEVVTRDAFSVEKSDVMTDIVENVYCGHNASILSIVNSEACVSMAQFATSTVLNSIMDKMEAAVPAGGKFEMWASAYAFPDPSSAKRENCRDLLALPVPQEPLPCEPGMSPIFGSGLFNVSEVHVYDRKDAGRVIADALGNSRESELVIVAFKVKQTRASASKTREVYVSSVFVAFFRGESVKCIPAILNGDSTTPATLFSTALGGASRTVVFAPVSATDAKEARTRCLEEAAALRNVRNTAIRSGSVRRFVDFTQKSIEKRAARGETASPMINKMRLMLIDAEELIRNPEPVVPKLYPAQQGEDTQQNGSVPPEEGNTKEPYGEEAKAAPLAATANSDVPMAETPRDAAPARQTQPTNPTPAATRSLPAGRSPSSALLLPDSKIAFVAVVEGSDGTKTSPARPLVLAGASANDKQMPTDELIERRTADQSALPESEVIDRAVARVLSGFNASILGAETVRSVPLEKQVTWQAFEKVVVAALENRAEGVVSTEVHLHMMVARQRVVVRDLVADKGPFPLVVANSPLVGALPSDVSAAVLTDSSVAKGVISAALKKASEHFEKSNADHDDDTMVLAVAVYKIIKQDDAVLCSLLAMSTPSMKPFEAIQNNDSRYSRSVFGGAVGGACVSAAFLVVDSRSVSSTDPSTYNTARAVRDVAANNQNAESRDGSIGRFVRYSNRAMDKASAMLRASEDPAQRDSMQRRMDFIRSRLKDHQALLDSPKNAPPPAYLATGEQRRGSGAAGADAKMNGGGNRESAAAGTTPGIPAKPSERNGTPAEQGKIRTVVTVIQGRGAGSDPVTVADNSVTAAGVTVKVDEAIELDGVALRCSAVDDLLYRHLAGECVALVAVDATGSTAGRTLATKLARFIVSNLPNAQSAVWWTLIVLNESMECKDMLAAAQGTPAPYERLRIGSGPTYGPIPCNAKCEVLKADDVEVRLRDAAAERNVNGGVVIASLMSRLAEPEKGDVLAPACGIVLCGPDASMVVEATRRDRTHRGLLSHIIGGPCATVYSVGVLAHEPADARRLLETVPVVGAVAMAPLRPTGLSRFTEYAAKSIGHLRREEEHADNEKKSHLQSRIELLARMKEDAELTIASPVTAPPMYYERK